MVIGTIVVIALFLWGIYTIYERDSRKETNKDKKIESLSSKIDELNSKLQRRRTVEIKQK